jgi:membrane-associated phospholipid phosphatase
MVLARIISYVLHPGLMPSLGFLILLNLDTYLRFAVQPQLKKYLILLTFINTFVFPALVLVLLKSRKVISSITLPQRKDRLLPFGVSCIFYLFTYNLLQKAPLPPVILSIFLGVCISVILTFGLTFFTKISAHMVGISGVLASILALYVKFYASFFLEICILAILWGLVGYARLYLKAHKSHEVYLGAVVGFIPVFLCTLWGITI